MSGWLTLVFWGAVVAWGQPHAPREHEIKAAALTNIIAFAEWPAEAFASPEAPLVIGILGHDQVAESIALLAEGENWRGRPLLLRRLNRPDEGRDCHVLWLGRSEHGRWPFIRDLFQDRPVLTISDARQFARMGGVVQLTLDRGRLRLIVNLAASRTSGVSISSKVLRLADVIGEERP